ncbi:hypothetical protein X750_29840 [Mesorhizobium sp. LNJC394B00]|nr:hypothetical protein X750_29840 [Mesorhizobium sp. LNJC394B00]
MTMAKPTKSASRSSPPIVRLTQDDEIRIAGADPAS